MWYAKQSGNVHNALDDRFGAFLWSYVKLSTMSTHVNLKHFYLRFEDCITTLNSHVPVLFQLTDKVFVVLINSDRKTWRFISGMSDIVRRHHSLKNVAHACVALLQPSKASHVILRLIVNLLQVMKGNDELNWRVNFSQHRFMKRLTAHPLFFA